MPAAAVSATRSSSVRPSQLTSAPSATAASSAISADPRLGRPEPAVAEREAPERLRLEVRVDREREVRDHEHEAGGQVHVRGEPEAEPDERGRGGVGEVVEVVAVARPLGAPHARERAVERVAEPVDDEQRRRRPQVPGRGRDGERDRRRERERGEVIGPDTARQPPRDRLEQPLLGPRQQERLLARGVRAGRRVDGGVARRAAAEARRNSPAAWCAARWARVCMRRACPRGAAFERCGEWRAWLRLLLVDHRSTRRTRLLTDGYQRGIVSTRTFRLPVDRRRKRLPKRLCTRASGAVPRSPRMARDCPTCGRTNADGKDFCDCGEYLRWDPTGVFAIPAQAAGVAAPATPAPRCRRTRPARRRHPSRPSRCCSSCAPPAQHPATARRRSRSRSPRPACCRASCATRPSASTPTRCASTDSRRRGWRSRRRRSTCSRTAPPATPTSRTSSSRSRPPRAPSARAGRHEFRLEAVSRATGAVVASAPGAIEILPYHELQLEALPEIRGGRRRVRFTATAATTGNAPIEVELGARDREEQFDLSFSPPTLLLEPNTPDRRAADRQAAAPALDRPPARADARGHRARARRPAAADADRRRPPEGLAPVLAPAADRCCLAALAAAFVLTRPETATMPDADRRDASTPPSSRPPAPASRRRPCSRRARPAAGPRSAMVDRAGAGRRRRRAARREARARASASSRERASVPDLKGMDLDQAQTALRKAKLKLGPANGDGVKGVVARQAPQPGEQARVGTGVTRLAARRRRRSRRPLRPRTPPRPRRRSRWPICARSRSPTRRASGSTRPRPTTASASTPRAGTPIRPGSATASCSSAPGQLFVVDADEQAEPEPLTDAEGWSSPHRDGGDAVPPIQDEQICVRVDRVEVPCRSPASSGVAWGSEGRAR